MKRYLAGIFAGVAIAVLGGLAASQYGWEARKAYGQATTTTQLPAVTVTTGVANSTAVQIAPTNPGRRTFSICNGSGAAIYVLPGGVTLPTTTSGVPIAVSTCLSPPANALQSGTVLGGGNSWYAIAQAAGPTVVAFIEW
jgi:hypothetical protein